MSDKSIAFKYNKERGGILEAWKDGEYSGDIITYPGTFFSKEEEEEYRQTGLITRNVKQVTISIPSSGKGNIDG